MFIVIKVIKILFNKNVIIYIILNKNIDLIQLYKNINSKTDIKAQFGCKPCTKMCKFAHLECNLMS